MMGKKPLQRQGCNVHGRQRSPRRNPEAAPSCPYDHAREQNIENQMPPIQTGNESAGPPLGGPAGSAQEFDISSNAEVPREQALTMSSDDETPDMGCERCPPGLARVVNRVLGQRHDSWQNMSSLHIFRLTEVNSQTRLRNGHAIRMRFQFL